MLVFGKKLVFILEISSERVGVKNFRATQKMYKNLYNALKQTDWKNIEKWASYRRCRENICKKSTILDPPLGSTWALPPSPINFVHDRLFFSKFIIIYFFVI